MISEHSLVVLDSDPSHEKLTRGDVGTVVHIYKDGKGYEVEFVDGGGQTVALITVGADDVRPLEPESCCTLGPPHSSGNPASECFLPIMP